VALNQGLRVIHLDTNILILSVGLKHPAREMLRYWSEQGMPLAVSSMVWAEFLCGPVTPALIRAWEHVLASRIVAVDARIAEHAAALFNHTGRRARSLPDCLIAATAMLEDAKLATLNRKDFAPFAPHGLQFV